MPEALPTTPYARWGDWPALVAALLALLVAGRSRGTPRAPRTPRDEPSG
jgi:apolipoprotein N-acyltransferase